MRSSAVVADADRPGAARARAAAGGRGPPLRGRDAELAAIGDALAAAATGRGSMVLLDGPAGAGRTRLLAEAAVMAGRNGLRVAVGRSPAAAAPMPFAPLL